MSCNLCSVSYLVADKHNKEHLLGAWHVPGKTPGGGGPRGGLGGGILPEAGPVKQARASAELSCKATHSIYCKQAVALSSRKGTCLVVSLAEEALMVAGVEGLPPAARWQEAVALWGELVLLQPGELLLV